MRRRGAWPIGMGGSNCFLSYNHALNHAGLSLSGVVGPDATARGSPRPLRLLRPAGRDSPRAVAPERLVGGRVRPYVRQPQLSESNWDLQFNNAKNSIFAVRGLLRAVI